MTESASSNSDSSNKGNADIVRLRGQATNLKRWPVLVVSGLAFLNGLLGIGSVLFVRFSQHPKLFDLVLPVGIYQSSRLATLTFGFVLLYLSANLFEGKRAAWWMAVVVTTAAALAHIGHGHFWFVALGPLVALAFLLFYKKEFTVASDPGGIARGITMLVFSLAVALAYGTAGFWLLDRAEFGINFSVTDSFLRTLREFTLVGNADLVAKTRFARWFLDSLDLFGLVALGFGLFSLFRPIAYKLHTLPQERAEVKKILKEQASYSLDYYKLLPDKSYYFSESRKSCIAYKTAWGVAISLGDPVGPDEELAKLSCSFLAYCRDNGWRVAFLQTLPDLLNMYRELGLKVLKVGEDALVDLDQFESVTLVKHKELKRKSGKLARAGFAVMRLKPPHTGELLDQVESVSNEWLSLPGRRERGFSLGQFERRGLAESTLAVLKNPEGQIIAFANEVPAYRKGEATIDLMRHRVKVPNGSMDFLFTELMLQLKAEGYKRFNLGLAALSGVGGEPGDSLEEQAMHQVYEHLNRFFSYKGLRRYKNKFGPEWEERFLIYQGGPRGLVKTGLAILKATEE